MKFTLFAVFLFSIGWMSVAVADDGPPAPKCCLSVTNTQIPVGFIVSYDIQERARCPVRAIRFYTKKNKVICSDPESEWAKYAMEIVDRRKTKSTSTIKCPTSTTNLIPTTNKTDKTQQTETETSTRTNPPPTSKTVPSTETTTKTSGPETSTSTSVPPTETTTKTSGPETSTSTAVPPIVTTVKTSGPEPKISNTALLTVSVSKDISELTAITCGTGETTATTETTTTTTRTMRVTGTTKKLSKMMIRKIGKKSKKGLRKYQLGNLKTTARSTVSS